MTATTSPAREIPRRVAVVGSGVAGLTAAHVISRSAHVTLFEADDRLGGHADTHVVRDAVGRELRIDTGFIVHNERTYPTLLRMFAELGVETQPSEMSMSVRDEGTGLEYAGALGASGLFPTWRHLGRRSYLRMLGEVPRFHRAARALLSDSEVEEVALRPSRNRSSSDETLRDFLDRGRFSAYFVRHFMEPLVAAVWSCDPETALDYPARYLFTFLDHHGMLAVFGSPQWRTVTGGSHEYVRRVAAGLDDVRTGAKVTTVTETADGVVVCDGNGEETTYDAVVIATHPAQALAMLAEPTPVQREVLGAITYTPNTAQLHTDTSVLPTSPRARASWNFLRRREANGQVTVTYDLTRLQRLPTEERYLVTLGGTDLVDPALVIDTMEYEHPAYTPTSVAAQRRLPECDSDRVVLAGAYQGWGFHEDGARSGAAAAERLGFTWDAPVVEEVALRPSRNHDSGYASGHASGHASGFETPAERAPQPPSAGRVYATTIRHARRTPVKHAFRYRSHTWLVDLDDLPSHGLLASFQARDHLGDPSRSIRENVDGFLASKGIDVSGGRILMLANARVLGYCFNPISVFWCHRADGALECVVVEVHNTYGDRHAYLVHTDEHGRAQVPKALYVSPFNDTSGDYELSLPVPGDRLSVGVTLRPHGFAASLTGQALAPGRRSLVAATVRTPWAPLLGSLRIRLQGVRLWLRGLKVQPRPTHDRQEGVQ